MVELEGNFVIAKSNKALKFLGAEGVEAIGSVVLDFVKNQDDIPFAFTLKKEEAGYQISTDVTKSLGENAFFCYFDPSGQLPSVLLKNYLAKLKDYYNRNSEGV